MSRYFKLLLVMVLTLAIVMPDAQAARRQHTSSKHRKAPVASGTSDRRYADLIMNPVTGEVYKASNPDAQRYPASLTKMMTLYMLFEALEQRRTTMDARLDVSEYAATMPQTNLALSPGESIPVETAIKALVVRSANDVAVVVAEALGGDVDRFGQMMTAKARQLGMRNTVFKNPNGLPNAGQYTTARDMAKLGIALKRDFPQYFRYFNTRQFSWAGVTYYTHNRVMLRYAGTDGIKTGFTGAAGFNLVTSVTRGGRPLVGVVLGGSSGSWRDNRMIQLLDTTYQQIAQRGGARGRMYTANLPLSKAGGKVGMGVSSAAIAASEQEMLTTKEDSTQGAIDEVEDGAPTNAAVGDISNDAVTVPANVAPVEPPPAVTPVAPVAAVHTQSPFAMASVAPLPTAVKQVAVPAKGGDLGWGIQVGAFSTRELADQSIQQAMRLSPEALQAAKPSIAPPVPNSTPVHRARLENISQLQARKACAALISNNSPCFIFKVGPNS